MIIVKCFVMPVYVSRMIGMSMRAYLQAFYLPIVSAGLLSILFYACDLDRLVLEWSLVWYFGILIAFMIGYALVFLAGWFESGGMPDAA
jgi:hypothetical protein